MTGKHRPRGALVALVGIASACALAAGLWMIARDRAAEGALGALSSEVVSQGGPAGDAGGAAGDGDGGLAVDWDALLAANPDACAWLRVAGTSVDVPVVAADGSDPDHWLTHDLWGAASQTGVPYLDWRCDADGPSMVVYGHRTALADYLFHDLAGAFAQDAFDGLGEAAWATRAGTAALAPLCSASVGMADTEWLPTTLTGAGELREWLSWAVSSSSATAPGARGLAASATRCLVLVTCNGRAVSPTTRTVTVFVAA